jgi:excisionase family DNA binding protein
MTESQLGSDGRRQPRSDPSTTSGREPRAVPFAERLSCTIDEACQATGFGRTKLYELIGTGQLVATSVGRRRLVMIRSLLALLDKTTSA